MVYPITLLINPKSTYSLQEADSSHARGSAPLTLEAVVGRRVEAVGDLDLVLVVLGVLAALPQGADGRQNGAAAALDAGVGARVLGVDGGAVEDAVVALVPVHLGQGHGAAPGADLVAGGVGHDLPHVGADVPAAEGVEAPVGADRGDLRVVVVEVGVGGADVLLGHGVAEQDADDAVLLGVGRVLVEGDQDEGVIHEALVVQQGLEEVASPGAGDGDRSVVGIRGWGRAVSLSIPRAV